jgi:hypothetical protein
MRNRTLDGDRWFAGKVCDSRYIAPSLNDSTVALRRLKTFSVTAVGSVCEGERLGALVSQMILFLCRYIDAIPLIRKLFRKTRKIDVVLMSSILAGTPTMDEYGFIEGG